MGLFRRKEPVSPVLETAVQEKTYGAKIPVVDTNICNVCRACVYLCRNEVFDKSYHRSYPTVINEDRCEDGCTLCAERCKPNAITFQDRSPKKT